MAICQPYFPAGFAGEKSKDFPLTDANDGDTKPHFPI